MAKLQRVAQLLDSLGFDKSSEAVTQLQADLIATQKELEEAREAADAYSKGVYSETMLKAAKVIAGGHALQNELLLERDRAEKAEQALALRGEPVAWAVLHRGEFSRIEMRKEAAERAVKDYNESSPNRPPLKLIPLYAAPISGESVAKEKIDALADVAADLVYGMTRGARKERIKDAILAGIALYAAPISGGREQKTDLRSRLIAGGYRSATDGSVRCGLKSCCGRHDCDNFIKATAVMDGTAEIAVSGERVREALQMLHDDTKSYIEVNNLGDPWHNQSMKLARDALTLPAISETRTAFREQVKSAMAILDSYEGTDEPIRDGGRPQVSIASEDFATILREFRAALPLAAQPNAYLMGSCTEPECRLCQTPLELRKPNAHHSGIPMP